MNNDSGNNLGWVIAAVVFVIIALAVGFASSGSSSSKSSSSSTKYDYVTKADGTRKWYDKSKAIKVPNK